jgi:predicted transcriptional regulator
MTEPFEGILGNSAELRLLEFLLPLREMEFNISELAEESEASRPTIQKTVTRLVGFGVMKISRKSGPVKYYRLDEASPFVSLLENLNNVLIERMLDSETLGRVYEAVHEHAPRPPCRPAEETLPQITGEMRAFRPETMLPAPTFPVPEVRNNAS